MSERRLLTVVADDFGIGPEVSRGILDLARQGLLSGTVLLVNSPHAEAAAKAWRRARPPAELGWHPCLTLARPVLPAGRVPSLVRPDGTFWPLGRFLPRLFAGRLRAREIEAELRAQHGRFCDLAGRPPRLVNGHHHVHIFWPVRVVLRDLLARQRRLPYVRRVREPWRLLFGVPQARCKRLFLSWPGRRAAKFMDRAGFPGNDWLAGACDPSGARTPEFLGRWLERMPGRLVELMCHPGYPDLTPAAGPGGYRVRELEVLRHGSFADACRDSGRRLVTVGELLEGLVRRSPHAA